MKIGFPFGVCVFFACALLVAGRVALAGEAADESYAVVVAAATAKDPQWKQVVEALVAKHRAAVIEYDSAVSGALARLREAFPRYICFVAKPEEAGRQFVAEVHRLTRRVDDDPYSDAIWGILTGYDAANALRIARHKEPLVIRRTAAATEIELEMCKEGVWYCELVKGKMVRKEPGQEPRQSEVPADTTQALVDALNEYKAQLFISSGHATERDWQIGYRYRNGQFRCEDGCLFGLDTQGRRFPVQSDNAKVYLPVGNCLMGHIDGRQAMALAFLNSAGVQQMIGYTVNTWYGYAGWGCLDYFVEQPGRFTLAEAVWANQQALLHRLETYFPDLRTSEFDPSPRFDRPIQVSEQARKAGLRAQDALGLLYDRDALAFYGDPKWEARMAPGPLRWEQSLTVKDGVYRFEVIPKQGDRSFQPVSTNGSQRGGRPIFCRLPHRLKDVQIVEGKELEPLVADDFLLVPPPKRLDAGQPLRVVFRATRAGGSGAAK